MRNLFRSQRQYGDKICSTNIPDAIIDVQTCNLPNSPFAGPTKMAVVFFSHLAAIEVRWPVELTRPRYLR
jgi:hypothetical protein